MNHCSLIGRLTVDPDIQHRDDGVPVATMHLQVDDHRDRADGPMLVTVIADGNRATTVARYLRAGRLVAVEGRLQQVTGANQHRRWQRLHILAHTIDFLPVDTGDRNGAERHTPATTR